MKIKESLGVGACAFCGGILRYLIGLWLTHPHGFPYGTLTVNLVGAFCLPFLLRYVAQRFAFDDRLTLALGTGFLGAFTTFSSFSVDALKLLQAAHYESFGLYVGCSLVGGLAMSLLADYWAVRLIDRQQAKQVTK